MSIHPPDRQAEYRACGAWTTITLASRVEEHAVRTPDAVAIVDGTDGRVKTFGQLAKDARRVAAFLSDRGVGRGVGVAVQLPNRYETVVVDVAMLMLGARLSPLLPNYRKNELQHILTVSRCAVLVVPERYRDFDHLQLADQLAESVSSLHTVLVVGDARDSGWPTLDDALAFEPLEHRPTDDASAVSEIIFTSGTESSPKAVMHSEETLNCSVEATARHIGLAAEDVVWMPSPIGHSTGLNFGVRMALLHGLPCVLQDRWDASHALELIERHRVTYTLAATTFLSDLLSASGAGTALRSMRHFGCGGAPVPKELVDEAAGVGMRVERLYGSTEALIVSWTDSEGDDADRGMHDGEVLAGIEVAILDDAGDPLAAGEAGEIAVRGPNVCLGFFEDPERTGSSFNQEGWLRTGDLGVLDGRGHLSIVGRKKEIIIRGGLNIAPREIEDLAALHPDIGEVAIVGLPDDRLGEIMCACVVPRGEAQVTFDGLVGFLEERGLAKYKLPQRLVVLGSLPRTPTGKLQKFAIQDAINRQEQS